STSWRSFTVFSKLGSNCFKADTIDGFTNDEVRITRVFYSDTREHLTNYGFDVLVVDVLTLKVVDFLNFRDDVVLSLFNTGKFKQIFKVKLTFGKLIGLFDLLTVFYS